MDEQNINVSDMYKKYYEKYKKESICLNIEKFKSNNCFHFYLRGCSYILDENDYIVIFRDFGSPAYPGYWLKNEDCKIIIDCRYKYFSFKFIIKKLEKRIIKWEKQYFEYAFKTLSLKHLLSEKAAIDVLKKEISFMKNRLIFEKWWFLK